jgi:hypothetical protein
MVESGFCKKSKIKKENEEKIFQIMEDKYKLENGKYAIKKALDECEFIRKLISSHPNESSDAKIHNLEDHIKLSKLLYRIKKSKEKQKKAEEKQILKRIFYRTKTLNQLYEDIESKILNGEMINNKNYRELIRERHLYGDIKKIYGDPKNIIKEYWNRVIKDLKRMTPKEIEGLKFLKKQQSIKMRVKKEGPNPFDEFNMDLVLAARLTETINKKEALILKYRYNLKGHRINSLKLIAGWLGVSHTTVRNIEKRALKKIQENKDKLKLISVRKPERKEISREEYKRRFGYYPLD